MQTHETKTSIHKTKRLKLVDRVHCNRQLAAGMASKGEEGSERRRKRAWKKPREAKGLGEPTATPVPTSTRTSSNEYERSEQAEALHKTWRETTDASRSASDLGTDAVPGHRPVLEIDGSVMEGVSGK